MSPLLNDNGQHCPRCGALGRAGSDWCTLCYADLRPQPEPEPEPEPELEAAAALVAADSLGLGAASDDASPVVVSRPSGKHARHSTTLNGDGAGSDAAIDAEAEADSMIALLAAESGRPPFSQISEHLDSVAAKAAFMAGGFVVLTLLLFGLMALFGSLL